MSEEKAKKLAEARKYADKYFQPTLKKILKRIKKASSRGYFHNEIHLGIEIESLVATGEWTEKEFRKKLLADKIIAALKERGYAVIPSTASGHGLLINGPEVLLGDDPKIIPTIITTWTIKW
ncbi:MAG: hypothetical protein HYV47_03430 [Candidatus Nealsonbacteria bacterium]|nr:hypothetical protein [Candidatus Nealsonbacteria bacterium]